MNQTVKMILAGVAGLGVGAILHKIFGKKTADPVAVFKYTLKFSGEEFLEHIRKNLREPASRESHDYYVSVENLVKSIYNIVNMMPTPEVASTPQGAQLLAKLESEESKLLGAMRKLRAESKRFLKGGENDFYWFGDDLKPELVKSYKRYALIEEQNKALELAKMHSAPEDSWYTRKFSGDSMFTKNVMKPLNKGKDQDEQYQRELEARGAGKNRNAYSQSAAELQAGYGKFRGTVKGIKRGPLVGAALGAAAGSVVPGVGTLIGAGIGAGAGLVGGIMNGNRAANKRMRKVQKERQEHLNNLDNELSRYGK